MKVIPKFVIQCRKSQAIVSNIEASLPIQAAVKAMNVLTQTGEIRYHGPLSLEVISTSRVTGTSVDTGKIELDFEVLHGPYWSTKKEHTASPLLGTNEEKLSLFEWALEQGGYATDLTLEEIHIWRETGYKPAWLEYAENLDV